MVNLIEVREDVITVDGPTSSGKNSVGFLLAQTMGYKYIDSGMIYRAGCLKIIKQNISPDNLGEVVDIYKNLKIKFEDMDGVWRMYLEGEDLTDKLHIPEISKLVPIIAAKPKVREVVKQIQRDIAQDGHVVISGRDIGSEIFPDAKFKFFLTASVETRAQRRFEQLHQRDGAIKYEDVLKDMIDRDKQDTQREASPMRVPEGAVVLDNTNLTINETVSKMLEHINV